MREYASGAARDYARIGACARARGRSLARFVREAVLQVVGAPDPPLYQLALVGRALERIANLPAGTPDLVALVTDALERHRILVECILREQRCQSRGES